MQWDVDSPKRCKPQIHGEIFMPIKTLIMNSDEALIHRFSTKNLNSTFSEYFASYFGIVQSTARYLPNWLCELKYVYLVISFKHRSKHP